MIVGIRRANYGVTTHSVVDLKQYKPLFWQDNERHAMSIHTNHVLVPFYVMNNNERVKDKI